MPKIAFILPHKELVEDAERIIQEDNEKIIARKGLLDEAISVAQELEKTVGIKIIIARGGTALILKQANLKSKIVELNINNYDLIEALFEAKKFGNRVGFLGFSNMIKRVEKLGLFLDIKLKTQILEETSDVQFFLERMKGEVDVVVGGVITVRLAKKMNINSVLIRTQNATLRNSIREAKNVQDIMLEEKQKREEIKIILNLINDGVIGVDNTGEISFMNETASKIIGIGVSEAHRKPIGKVFSKSGILKVLKTGIKDENDIENFNGQILNISRIPIKLENNITGGIEILQDVSKIEKIEKNVRKKKYLKGHYAKYTFDDVLGKSRKIKFIIEKAKKYSLVNSNILIYGETGTGKEMLVQSIHNHSHRKSGPFVAINCAALPESLLESELFGYVDGAFTGAQKGGKKGLFELAHKGTIFLDEVSEMTSNLQSRLLRVLEEQEVRKIGDDQVIPVDLRVIAASNKDLIRLIEENKFRSDLFFRLNVLSISLPPLRERLEDMNILVNFFIKSLAVKLDKSVLSITKKALARFKEYSWPGNIRELKNLVERIVVVCENQQITEDIIDELFIEQNSVQGFRQNLFKLEKKQVEKEDERMGKVLKNNEELSLNEISQLVEKVIIEKMLKYNHGNKTKTARDLGIDRATLWRKLKKTNDS